MLETCCLGSLIEKPHPCIGVWYQERVLRRSHRRRAGHQDFLSNPTVQESNKKDLVKRIAQESDFNQYTVNFLNVLIDQGRIHAIQEILRLL